jgi:CheY-like chemotaxis protein
VQVILCDQCMPLMSGTEFMERVKNLAPDTFRIMLSACRPDADHGRHQPRRHRPLLHQAVEGRGAARNIREGFRLQAQMHGAAARRPTPRP